MQFPPLGVGFPAPPSFLSMVDHRTEASSMIEKKAESKLALSEASAAVTITTTLSIDFRPHDQGVEIQGPLMLAPDDQMEKLYSDGLRAGVFRAVYDAHGVLATTGISIKLISWQVPERLDALGEEELARLANELEKMTYNMVYPVLAEKMQ